MRPLIPKVRPGDVLKGTRNLRRYLRAAAQNVRSIDLSHGHKRDTVKPCNPSKSDEFLVIANAWGTFGAVCQEKSIVLLFQNPPTVPPFGPPTFMNPTIFSSWFIRTGKRLPQVSQWPNYAVRLWAGLHLNLAGLGDYALVLIHANGARGHFTLASNNARPTRLSDLFQIISVASVQGRLRGKNPEWRGSQWGYGPRLEDIQALERENEEIRRNPRIASWLDKEGF